MENEKDVIFALDAETTSLWGKAFAIGVALTNLKGNIIKTWVGRCPAEDKVDPWVEENVLPQMEGIPVTHKCYKDLLAGFVEFYMENKDNAHIVVHMGLPVEARLFLDAHQLGFIGDWDAPFPLIDASAFPKIGTSVDNYNAGNGVVVDANMFTGGTHNPLYDSYATALAYLHITDGGGIKDVRRNKEEIIYLSGTKKDLGRLLDH